MNDLIDIISTNYPPQESPTELWNLQLALDRYAQGLFGPRSPSKKLFPPEYTADGPQVRNTKQKDGGYAELSYSAANSWPLTVFQLAHETVHLLDPRAVPPHGKGANWLEEGIAVQFSLVISRGTAGNINIAHKKYEHAKKLILELGPNHFKIAKIIRENCGHFSDCTPSDIAAAAPHISTELATKLASSFYN